MPEENKTIAFAGGGTGGHVYPMLPVVERVCQAGYEVFWIGSSQGMERGVLQKEQIPFYSIPCGKLRRYLSWKNLTDCFRTLGGIFASWRLLRRLRPRVLVSKGGFVSVPPVAAARLLGIPVLTHESDMDPGLANRLNILLGARPLLSYQETEKYLSPGQRKLALVTGNPVRDSVFSGNPQQGRSLAQAPADRPLILVLGGSLGARQINELIEQALPFLLEQGVVVHQVGAGNPLPPGQEGYWPAEYFQEELPHLLAAADLCVSRAGAGVLWELAATGTPGILIPLEGTGTRGDQVRNAGHFQRIGMAQVLDGKKASPQGLLDAVGTLLEDKGKLLAMAAAARALPARRAADHISRLLKEIVG